MARGDGLPADDDDEPGPVPEEPAGEEPEERDEGKDERSPRGAPPRHRRPKRRPPRGRANPSVRPWRISDLDEETDEVPADEPRKKQSFFRRRLEPIYFRARDSWYFEPLLALAIIVLLLVSLWAYTQNWPPVYVVESDSMQHGSDDHVGLINTGDLVLAQKIPPADVVPYVLGAQEGFVTYGEYGDVILYHPNGDLAATPIIHRALVYLEWDASDLTYSVPALVGQPCGSASNAVYSVTSSANGCGATHMTGTLTLYRIGWRNLTVPIDLSSLGHYSGFITLGDNNRLTDQADGLSGLVKPGWVLGVARGMIPWVGALKLLVSGRASEVPVQSWQFLTLSFVGIVLAGLGVHYLFRAEGVEDPRRKRQEEEAEEESEEGGATAWAGRPTGSRWRGLRTWLSGSDEGEEEEDGAKGHARPHRPLKKRKLDKQARRQARERGRPDPAIRSPKSRPRAARQRSADEDDQL